MVAIGVAIAIAVGIAIFMTYHQPKSSTSVPIDSKSSTSVPIDSKSSTSVPIDSMGMMHVHIHLKLVFDGKEAPVPVSIGIDPILWQDHSLDSYGMQGMAPLHTHDTSGTIHVESYKIREYTFGQLLDIWGINLNGNKVSMTVNDQSIQDYRNYVFKDGDKVTLSIDTK